MSSPPDPDILKQEAVNPDLFPAEAVNPDAPSVEPNCPHCQAGFMIRRPEECRYITTIIASIVCFPWGLLGFCCMHYVNRCSMCGYETYIDPITDE